MTEFSFLAPLRLAVAALLLATGLAATAQGRAGNTQRAGDYIAVVVNQELVTAGELDRRLARVKAEATGDVKLPPDAELRRQLLDTLIDERVMISTARESGMRIDEPEVDRAVQSIAQQNQITLPVLREEAVPARAASDIAFMKGFF